MWGLSSIDFSQARSSKKLWLLSSDRSRSWSKNWVWFPRSLERKVCPEDSPIIVNSVGVDPLTISTVALG